LIDLNRAVSCIVWCKVGIIEVGNDGTDDC